LTRKSPYCACKNFAFYVFGKYCFYASAVTQFNFKGLFFVFSQTLFMLTEGKNWVFPLQIEQN